MAFTLAGSAVAEEDWETPDWKPIGDVRAEDAAFLGRCVEAEPDCASRRVALVSLGGRRYLLLVESPSKENCGEHDFSVYGAVSSGGKRSDIPDFSYCANTLKYRPKGPDFLVSGVRVGSDISGPSGWVFEDVRIRREKGAWTETVVMVIDYRGGKPKN